MDPSQQLPPSLLGQLVDKLLHQGPSLSVALLTIAILAGWIPSPVLLKLDQNVAALSEVAASFRTLANEVRRYTLITCLDRSKGNQDMVRICTGESR